MSSLSSYAKSLKVVIPILR